MLQKNITNINDLTSLSQKCKTLNQLKQIHAQILKIPSPSQPQPHQNPLALSPLLAAAAKNPTFLAYARAIFATLRRRNTFVYNLMIRGHAQGQSPIDAVLCYMDMLNCGLRANRFTFPGLIMACSVLGSNSGIIGRLVHAHVVKFGVFNDPFVNSALIEFYSSVLRDVGSARLLFDQCPKRDVVLWTAMVDGYAKMGEVERAREVFDEMPERNAVSWSAMMAGYSRLSEFREVMSLFGKMQEMGTKPNESVLVTVLTACANLGAVTPGLWVHSYAKRNKLESNKILATALVDMYSKCGLVEAALEVFEGIRDKDVEAWNAMITGFAINGNARKSLELFNEMNLVDQIKPTETTFISVLAACTHAKMVPEGLKVFDEMDKIHGVKPRREHYSCIVDLLGRAGMVEEAERFVEERIGGIGEWDPNVWGALLGACRVHGKVEVGNRVWRKLVEMGISDFGAHVLSYNMYREAGWEAQARRVRKSISKKGMAKPPGCSVIEVNNVVEEFIAGDLCHPKAQEIVKTLDSFFRMANLEDI